MTGTRLFIHTTFMVELLTLVICSYFYAINKPNLPSESAEPFIANQSGWQVLVEDVTPAPSEDDVSFIQRAEETVSVAVEKLQSILGIEVEKKVYQYKPRRESAFVQEMKHNIASIHEDKMPPLILQLHIPQIKSSDTIHSLAESLEKGFLMQHTYNPAKFPSIQIGKESLIAVGDVTSCDNFQLPIHIRQDFKQRDIVMRPHIILLFGCSDSTIPDPQITIVDDIGSNGRSDDIIIVRTKLTVDQITELKRELEKYVPIKILMKTFAPHTPLSNEDYRLESVSIQLIDENPASHVSNDNNGLSPKAHFDIIGKELSSSAKATITPLLDDLSFVYGGQVIVGGIDTPEIINSNAIDLEVHSSAYLSLPDNIVKLDTAEHEITALTTKYVSSEGLANWMHKYSNQQTRRITNDIALPGNLEWTLFVPSAEHAPLVVNDKSSSKKGSSIILSPASLDGGRTDSVYPNGMSIVNLPDFNEHLDSFDLDQLQQSYKEKISQSLEYLVGCIRALHGLPTFTSRRLSFWEMESVARSQYSKTLETALSETDVLMAVLHQHRSTLAFPTDVAYKLNNATNLLRQSISLIEQGFPSIYATPMLHQSIQYIESVQSDHQFHELPYFAIDHYLAIFSPLVLPLVLPMIAGLIREVKRFKKHKKEKTSFFANFNDEF